MQNDKLFRQRDIRILLPEHHKPRLAIPVADKTTIGTPEGSPFRLMRMTALRTDATGAAFPDEARCDTGFLRLVPQVLLDSPRFHLGDLLAGHSTEPPLDLCVLLHPGWVADHQFANSMLDAPGDRFSGCLVQKVSNLDLGLALEAAFGPDEFLPAPASPGATGERPVEPTEGLVALPLDGANLPPGDHEAGTILGHDRNRVDLADVDPGPNAWHGLRVGIFTGVAQDVPALAPEDVAGVDLFGDGNPGVKPVAGRESEDQGAGWRPFDRHLLEGDGDKALFPPRVAGGKSLATFLRRGLAVGAETVSQPLDCLTVQLVAPLQRFLEFPLADPSLPGVVVGFGQGDDVVPTTGRFLQDGFKALPVGSGKPEYALAGLDH